MGCFFSAISLKWRKIGPRLLLTTHTRFRLVPKLTTLDYLERPLCTLFQNACVFRSAKMLRNDSSFWQHMVFADIHGGSLERGRQTIMGLSKTTIFSTFAQCFFRCSGVCRLPLTPKYVTLNDLKWPFYVKLCFSSSKFAYLLTWTAQRYL